MAEVGRAHGGEVRLAGARPPQQRALLRAAWFGWAGKARQVRDGWGPVRQGAASRGAAGKARRGRARRGWARRGAAGGVGRGVTRHGWARPGKARQA